MAVSSSRSEAMDVGSESQHSPESAPRKVKLRQQIEHMAVTNLRQSHQIRRLQKRVRDQKKKIFKLQSVIAELQKKPAECGLC